MRAGCMSPPGRAPVTRVRPSAAMRRAAFSSQPSMRREPRSKRSRRWAATGIRTTTPPAACCAMRSSTRSAPAPRRSAACSLDASCSRGAPSLGGMSIEFNQIQMEPAYRKVAVAIGGRILDRSLPEGDRLPPETELARQFGVNRSTIREALRELESNGLVTRRPGSKLMSVSRPQHLAIAGAVTRGLVLHDVTFMEVWEALTLLEPPIAEVAAGARTAEDLSHIAAAAAQFAADNEQTGTAVHRVAEFFRTVGRAAHNQVLMLAQET